MHRYQRPFGQFILGFVFIALLSAFFPFSLSAAPVLVRSTAELGSNDFVAWAPLGDHGTGIPNGPALLSNGGKSLTMSKLTGDFLRVDEGNVSTGWIGNFAPGTPLIWTENGGGPVSFVFDRPILGAGAKIQANIIGTFDAFISAFDANNSLLGSFSVSGNSTRDQDDSAIFVGIFDADQVIRRIDFNVTGNDFAMSRLELAVPLPATFWLFGSSLFGLAVRRRIAARA
jgi:hypothetical protein